MNYKRIEIDGNDGVGKTTRVKFLQKLYPNVEILDRGLLSELTLQGEYFEGDYNINSIDKFKEDTLYILLFSSIKTKEKRIIQRGGSLDEKFHRHEDLEFYDKRFEILSKNSHVHTICADNFLDSIKEICQLFDGSKFDINNLHTVYLGGVFDFQYKDFCREVASQDYRAKVIGDLDLFLYKNNDVPVLINRNTNYIGPFYFYTNEMTADDVVGNEIEMTENCTDAFFVLTNGTCPGTITELIHTSMKYKNVYIYYVYDKDTYDTPENELNSPCRYPILFSKKWNKNTKIKLCNSVDECISEIKKTIKSFAE